MSAKYPRMPHLPWSPGCSRDDRIIESVYPFLNTRIVITEKMDGSNVCLTHDTVYARSHNGPPTHPSYDWIKAHHAKIRHNIEPGYSIFGEYCYAKHSIYYNALPGYFMVFGIRDDSDGHWFGYSQTEGLVDMMLDLPMVPHMWEGAPPLIQTEEDLRLLVESLMDRPSACGMEMEGLVIRVEDVIHPSKFSTHVAKYVRADHVQSDDHWTNGPIVKNGLAIG